ncbi:MAG: hypothetical protein AAB215_05900 [Planctomycetota bacterium]
MGLKIELTFPTIPEGKIAGSFSARNRLDAGACACPGSGDVEMFTVGSLSRAFHQDVQGFLVADLDASGLRVRRIELPAPLKKPPVR